jgi:Flp pilus assembly protein TadB
MNEKNLQELWKAQPTEEVEMSLMEVTHQANKFQRTLQGLRYREFIVGFALIAWFIHDLFVLTNAKMLLGSVLSIVGLLYIMWQLHQRTKLDAPNASEFGDTCAAFHRRALVRHRDALRTVGSWYLAPLIPGFIASTWGTAEVKGSVDWMTVLIVGAVFFAIYLLNLYGAKQLQKQIDELPR